MPKNQWKLMVFVDNLNDPKLEPIKEGWRDRLIVGETYQVRPCFTSGSSLRWAKHVDARCLDRADTIIRGICESRFVEPGLRAKAVIAMGRSRQK